MAGMFEEALRRAGKIGKYLEPVQVEYEALDITRQLSGMSAGHVKLFAEEVDTAIRYMHPGVREIITRHAVGILDELRITDYQTNSGYGGSMGGSSSLYFTIGRAYDFINPDIVSTGAVIHPAVGHGAATDNRRVWTRTRVARTVPGAPTPYVTGIVATVGTATDLRLQEEEGMIFLGLVERSDVTPMCTAMQLVYNSDTYNFWDIEWSLHEEKEQNVYVWEMPQEIKVPPEQAIQINVRYDDIGISYMQPIVFRFLRSSDMRAL